MKKTFRAWIAAVLAAVCLITPLYASGGDEPEERMPVSAAVSETPPGISAESAVLTDGTGRVLYARNADERLPMASTTKIMTALTALRLTADPDAPVKIPAAAVGVEGSSVYLYQDEVLSMRELLYAMLMESANDAAAAIAIACSGSVEAFAAEMNSDAVTLGLTDTHFMNPHGLDDEAHYTTARELALITAEALRNAEFRKIVSTYRKEIPLRGGEGVRLLVNHNRLLKSYEGCIGVKTGFTKRCGRCLVSAAERDGCTLICVTLNAPDDWNDHAALLDWGFSRYGSVTLAQVGERFASVPVTGAENGAAAIPAESTATLQATLLKDGQNLRKVVELPRFLYAPVARGDVIGRVIYYNNEEKIGELPLYAGADVKQYVKPTLWQRIRSIFGFG